MHADVEHTLDGVLVLNEVLGDIRVDHCCAAANGDLKSHRSPWGPLVGVKVDGLAGGHGERVIAAEELGQRGPEPRDGVLVAGAAAAVGPGDLGLRPVAERPEKSVVCHGCGDVLRACGWRTLIQKMGLTHKSAPAGPPDSAG